MSALFLAVWLVSLASLAWEWSEPRRKAERARRMLR